MNYKIEKLIYGGFGLTRDDSNRPIFVHKSVPGDKVTLKMIDHKKSYSTAVINGIIEEGEARIIPRCPSFKYCGGCEHQNISYINQLSYKSLIFNEVMLRSKIETLVDPIVPGSCEEFYYRNVIRFGISCRQNEIFFYMNNFILTHPDIVIDKCFLQSETANQIMATIKRVLSGQQVDLNTFWQLRIREAKSTGQFMVEIMTDSHSLPCEQELLSELKQVTGVKSIYHVISSERNLRKLKRRLLFGSPVIIDKIGAFGFQISPDSFFQTNAYGVKRLYDTIKVLAEPKINETILDLYCGTGSIGIYLSTLAKKVVGVELSDQAVRDAKDNIRINKIYNCEFISSDAECYLRKNKNSFDKIIVDPPRAGLNRTIIRTISVLNPKRVVYVSCNPSTFARDIKEFEKHNFRLKRVQPIDMFPQTHHIECVGQLEKEL